MSGVPSTYHGGAAAQPGRYANGQVVNYRSRRRKV